MNENLRNDEVIRISNEILKQRNYNISLYDLIKKMIKKQIEERKRYSPLDEIS